MRQRATIAHQLAENEASAWPVWARAELCEAIEIAREFRAVPRQTTLAGELYHEWFTPPVAETPPQLLRRPLAGLYRQAHAGSTRQNDLGEVPTIDRRDAIGRDRWWRTWGPLWSPARGRTSALRLLFSPDMNALTEFVRAATQTLVDIEEPWLLACPTLPSRLRHSGSVVLYLPDDAALRAAVIAGLDPYLRNDTPPLCLPLSEGVAVAEHPGNGMTFGEHRCHLVALAIERAEPETDPLRAIANMFAAHGISPAEPHRGNVLG
jgi:hypothetical protein